MISPDYYQTAQDHQCLLIVVKQIGSQINPRIFSRIYDQICNQCEISISDAQGMVKRKIQVRYKQSYTCDSNDWGDFQAHRKVLGLITIGKCSSDGEAESLQELHNSIKETYSNTLYDSRCFIINQVIDSQPTTPDQEQFKCIIQSPDGDSVVNSDSTENLEIKAQDSPVKFFNSENNNDEEQLSSFHITEDDIVDFDLNERLPSSTLEPIPLDVNLVSHVNIDSSESSPSSDDFSAHNGNSNLFTLNINNNNDNDNSNIDDSLSKSQDDLNIDKDDYTFDPSEQEFNSKNLYSSSSKSQFTQCIRYNSNKQLCDQIEKDLKDFISSLFWVLESKRLDRSHEKQDKVPLLIAPIEKKDIIGLDTDTKTFRKRCLGRMKKHIGDLSLLAGLPTEALMHYSMSIDLLRSVGDWLWLASSLEGQCVASLVLLFPESAKRITNATGLQRNSSLPAIKKSDLNVVNNKRPSSASRSLPNGSDPSISKALGKSILTPNEIYEKYKEAACHYAKYRSAAILEFESSFKAARVLTFLGKYLNASEFIQNAVFINFNQTNDEQIDRLSVIAELYANIGYLRKSAFYKRFAALKAVSTNLQNPNWERCYYLLLPALEGYFLTLDPNEYQRRLNINDCGWPGIHLQLLQELITTSMRMNNEPLAMRHLSFLLHSLFDYLTASQRKDFSTRLLSLSSGCGEGSPVPLKLPNGSIIPSVNFTKFPLVTAFKVQCLSPQLRPIKLKSKLKPLTVSSTPSSPFIFTPLQLNRSTHNTPRKSVSMSTQLDFKWIQGEVCQIALMVQNILPIELNANHMSILTDGIAFETHPISLSLPPESSQTPINLSGIPRNGGNIDILGYSTHVLGVKSDCRLRELPGAKRMKLPNCYTIEVIPPLPLMGLKCTLPKSNHTCTILPPETNHIFYSGSISLYAGEKRKCTVTLTNQSPNEELIEIVNISVCSKLSKENQQLLFEWDDNAINNDLPLDSGSSLDFELTINAIGGFVADIAPANKIKPKSNVTSSSTSPIGSHHNSPLHSKKSQILGSSTLANFISDLQTNKQKQKDKTVTNVDHFSSKMVEAVLTFEYSGGNGLASGYCRQCSLAINIEILPSLLITHWDVLPGEQPSECFLVLDTFNATNFEVDLNYAPNKDILIESKESCRIPVPIERCPLFDDEDHDNLKEAHQYLMSRCKSHLVNQVSLKWSSPENLFGEVSIVSIPWSNEVLQSILLSPLQWEVNINGQQFDSSEEFSFSIGENVSINISLCNCSSKSLKSLCLWIQCYQDFQNDQRKFGLLNKKDICGFDRVIIDEIASKDSYLHKFGLTFYHKGVYKLDIQCSEIDLLSKQKDSSRQESMSDIRLPTKSSLLWKRLPSIEINIE